MTDPQAKTLFDKIWDNHVAGRRDAATSLIYIDLHLIHELSSPQAFESLAMNKRKVRRPGATLAVPDHNVPTTDRDKPVKDGESALQIQLLEENTKAHGIEFFSIHDACDRVTGYDSPVTMYQAAGAWKRTRLRLRPQSPGGLSNWPGTGVPQLPQLPA